ncbi:MAG: hypothetical protein ACKO4T_06695 [Planctomycetaceae bacterium]
MHLVRSVAPLPCVIAACLIAALGGRGLRADSLFDSATTVVVGGTNFGNALTVGGSGTAAVVFGPGGSGTNTDGFVGLEAGSRGTVSVAGGTWTNTSLLVVGAAGDGTVTVASGSAGSWTTFLGSAAGSTGHATVSGGTFASSYQLQVGGSGAGTLDVTGGFASGVVAVTGTLAAGDWGTMSMAAGGVVQAATVLLSATAGMTGMTCMTWFADAPGGGGFGTIAADAALTYGGGLGIRCTTLHADESFSLFSLASIVPAGHPAFIVSSGTGAGGVYDGMLFVDEGLGRWVGTAANGQTVSFSEETGVLSFSAVPEPPAWLLAVCGTGLAWCMARLRGA